MVGYRKRRRSRLRCFLLSLWLPFLGPGFQPLAESALVTASDDVEERDCDGFGSRTAAPVARKTMAELLRV